MLKYLSFMVRNVVASLLEHQLVTGIYPMHPFLTSYSAALVVLSVVSISYMRYRSAQDHLVLSHS